MIVDREATLAPTRSPSRNRWRRTLLIVGVALGVVALLILATYHLEVYPTTWFDEGSHLHVPKALVQRGVYADVSSEGLRYFGPTVGVGPTVMLPIALAFEVAGIGLVQARLVVVGYLLAAIGLGAALTRRSYGAGAALLATFFLVTTPGLDLIATGRQVLGEVPALAFLFLGILLWWRSIPPKAGVGASLLAGFAFGLMALTKNQFALVLAPTLALVFALDRLFYRQLRPSQILIPLAIVFGAIALGYAALFALALQTQDLGHLLALWRQASAGAIFVFAPRRMLSSLKFLASPAILGSWGLPALLYGIACARVRSRAGLEQAFLATFALVGLAWYVLGSIGWPRYAFSALAILPIFAAKLVMDVGQALARSEGPAVVVGGARYPVALISLIALVGLGMGYPLGNQVQALVAARDRAPQEMAAYVDAHVPPGEVVETWEPELGFLGDHPYHYPPPAWLDRAVRAQWLGATNLLTGYDPFAEADPAYLVVGPFGKYTGIYAALLARSPTPPVVSIGAYDLYRLR